MAAWAIAATMSSTPGLPRRAQGSRACGACKLVQQSTTDDRRGVRAQARRSFAQVRQSARRKLQARESRCATSLAVVVRFLGALRVSAPDAVGELAMDRPAHPRQREPGTRGAPRVGL